MDISGKVAAITGGASGLGEATVRHFLQSGAKVVILDLNDENAKKLIDELGDENLKYINTNIMEEEPVKKAMVYKFIETLEDLQKALNDKTKH